MTLNTTKTKQGKAMDQRLFSSSSRGPQLSPRVAGSLRQLGNEHPSEFVCPVSLELMNDPVIVSTGHTFDRPSIEAWFATGRMTNPVTGIPLTNRNLTPNFALRDAIATYRAAQEAPLPISLEEETKRLIYAEARELVEALEAHIGTIEGGLGLEPDAAKSYVATVLGLIRKRSLGLLLLPNPEETCCIPEPLIPFITAFIMSHGALMSAQQHAVFCKAEIEVPLNRGEALRGDEDNVLEHAAGMGRK